MNCGNKKTFSTEVTCTYILMPVDLLHTYFVVHSGTTRVFIYLQPVCVSTPIFTIARIRMLIWLSCYYCYMIILYVMYALYNVLLCKSGNGKPSYACVRFVFTPRLSRPRKSPRVTFQTWHYWVVSRRLIRIIYLYCYFSCSSLVLRDIALYKIFFKHLHHNDIIIRFLRNYSFVYL